MAQRGVGAAVLNFSGRPRYSLDSLNAWLAAGGDR